MSKKEDLKLRNQYRGQFETCEVSKHMPPADLWAVRKLGSVSHLEVHHIFSRGGRSDLWSNLVVINPVIHRNWGHDFNPRELMIVSLYSKFIKSRLIPSPRNPFPDKEFNIDELNESAGKRVLGVLENFTQEFPEESDYYQMCKLITEAFKGAT